MNDRLSELRRGGSVNHVERADIEVGAGGSGSAFMQGFFNDVAEIKKAMSSIRYNIRQIEQNHGECLTAISAEQGRDSTERLEALMKQTNAAATQVRNKLKAMDIENKDFARQRSNEGSSEARIRINMHGTLTRKFVDLMGDYQEIQTKYKNKYRERVERQYRIVKPTASKEEIEQAFDSGDIQPEIFTQQILQGPGHAAARNALADIQERHRDITRLETSIAELHQLFLDMSVLVESQGELLDQIEYTVSQSVNYTGKAVEELRTANKYQRKVRKKMCIVVCCVLVILIIIITPTAISQMSKGDQRRRLAPSSLVHGAAVSWIWVGRQSFPVRAPIREHWNGGTSRSPDARSRVGALLRIALQKREESW